MANISETLEALKAGISDLFNSDRYADYLRFLARFHNYSAANCLLIWSQRPDASLVASYSDWKKQGRQVRRGERGIHIIAPHTIKNAKKDGDDDERIGFHGATTFDVSQTFSPDNKPLPALCSILDGRFSAFVPAFSSLCQIAPVPVEVEPMAHAGINGYFSPAEFRIVLREGLPEEQTLKTLVHEIAHSILHCEHGEAADVDRRTREVQAESIAYVVCNWLGLDTAEYSFGYIAGWSENKELPELHQSLNVIRRTSERIISDLEGVIEPCLMDTQAELPREQ